MTYKIQHFGRAVLKLCAHSGTTDVRALKQASKPFDRGALRLLGTSGKFSPYIDSSSFPIQCKTTSWDVVIQ